VVIDATCWGWEHILVRTGIETVMGGIGEAMGRRSRIATSEWSGHFTISSPQTTRSDLRAERAATLSVTARAWAEGGATSMASFTGTWTSARGSERDNTTASLDRAAAVRRR
jgi:hypothetical protein